MSRGFRVGHGIDAHRFRAGRQLRLGGLDLDSPVGLEGHSDGDVALHAVIDALLGAVAAGDLGDHFPSADDSWRDADSSDLVARTVAIVADHGFEPSSCDLTIIGERPRIAGHRRAMREAIAGLLGLPVSAVSVKGTTSDGLGFTGRGEGLAASAVVMVSSRDD